MKKYVYESPDGGKTVYKREVGNIRKREIVHCTPTGRKFNFSFKGKSIRKISNL